jgi:uncharacterized protein YndB with AHSA1/START domain
MKNETKVEQKSERELVVTRTINGPARIVYAAWTKPELMQRWWVPKSTGMTLVSCEQDVRVGGTYRLVIRHPAAPEPMAFYGKYLEVIPNARLVWTNEEGGDNGAITTVSFEEIAGKTRVVVHELHPSKAARDEACGAAEGGMNESFQQLDELIPMIS